jgi:uncharacterized protein (TIGR03032 family)
MSVDKSASEANAPWVNLYGSRHLVGWLTEQNISLAFTTYQAGKLFLLGRRPDGQLAVHERSFPRCMGLWSDGDNLWMSSLFQLWRLKNALEPGDEYQGHDRLYVPRVAYTTGDLDLHDVAVNAEGEPIFANTKFSCLATVSHSASFKPVWQPPFITKLAPEDRCHLNGLALVDGRPKYVTAVSTSDVLEGWRSRRTDGGAVLDVDMDACIATGISMPHSPRWYRGQLWLHQSGTGEFGRIEGPVEELYDVVTLPNVARPMALGFVTDEIQRILSIERASG